MLMGTPLFDGILPQSGRIPVVSASGVPLMPCKPAKALRLLESGKAFLEMGEDGKYYLRLRFDPKSPIVSPRRCEWRRGLVVTYLAELRKKAMRRRIWYRVLSGVERTLVDLTMKYVGEPRSLTLISALARIIVKVKQALVSPLRRFIGLIGRPLAMKISRIAMGWGYRSAWKWAEDEGFIRYLTVISEPFQKFPQNQRIWARIKG